MGHQSLPWNVSALRKMKAITFWTLNPRRPIRRPLFLLCHWASVNSPPSPEDTTLTCDLHQLPVHIRLKVIIYSLLFMKHCTSKYWTSPRFLLGFTPWIQLGVKQRGTCKQEWHFHPEGRLILNMSTDRFLMPANRPDNRSPKSLVAKSR